MGNAQAGQSTKKQQFIEAIRVIPPSQSLADLTTQIEQVFGINSIPVSHRAQFAQSNIRSLAESFQSCKPQRGKEKEYEERISHLQSELNYLKSIIEESKFRSREGSPVRSEVEEQQSAEVQQSSSRLSRTYFDSRSYASVSRNN